MFTAFISGINLIPLMKAVIPVETFGKWIRELYIYNDK